jgi:hypothetical protein
MKKSQGVPWLFSCTAAGAAVDQIALAARNSSSWALL